MAMADELPLKDDRSPGPLNDDQSPGEIKKVSDNLRQWTDSTAWWVVKGTTGSGKTYFVEQLKERLIANNSPVIYVPQYPMFKPQLGVKKYISLLPLSPKVRQDLFSYLSTLEVPIDTLIGGKLMGMLDIPGLSGGQRKKLLIAVCVALALELQCPFVVLDEPFAGVDASAMREVLNVMSKATAGVRNLKYIIVTHDHFELLPSSATILKVHDRKITSDGTDYSNDNVSAAMDFTMALVRGQMVLPARRPIFDFYVVKRHFIEQEFVMPMISYIIFGLLVGGAVVNYKGGLPGHGRDAIYVFVKIFFFEYPHFGNILNYCYKRGQHYEDFYLNITTKEFMVFEQIAIIILQMTVLWLVAEAVLCGVCQFWWINAKVALVDLAFLIQDSCYFMLLPVVTPNPIVAILSALPYVCSVCFFNGVLLPQEYIFKGIKWMSIFSPMYHTGCAVTHVTDKIKLAQTDCSDSLIVHMIFLNPACTAIFIAILIKMFIARRTKDRLVVPGLAHSRNSLQDASMTPVEPLGAGTSQSDSTGAISDSEAGGTLEKTESASKSKDAPLSSAMRDTLLKHQWWIIKGATGSGKTFFLECMKHELKNAGEDVVFVSQYPMFKPQVPVMRFLKMQPFSSQIHQDMLKNLGDMEVPLQGLVGGKMLGMLDMKGLSGGQRKKLLIALAVATASQFQSKFIIMDESFAGIDFNSMKSVTQVLQSALVASPGLKIVFSTHDHFETFKEMFKGKDTATIVHVEDRLVSVQTESLAYTRDNKIAATEFVHGMSSTRGSVTPKHLIDFYVIKRHFIEQEPVLPIVQTMLFALLLGLTVVNYDEGHPSTTWPGAEVVYIFMKAFILEYPLFGGIINFCYKREQHFEDFYLNTSSSRFCCAETIIVAVIQQCLIVLVATGILCAIKSDFWWLNGWVMLIDMWYATFAAIGYLLLPIVIPNPILAMASIFPYVCVWAFANGILLPKGEMWDGMQWMTAFSPLFNIGCAYKHATDGKKILLPGSTCYDSIVPHILVVTPFPWIVCIGVAYKMWKTQRGSRRVSPQKVLPTLDDSGLAINSGVDP